MMSMALFLHWRYLTVLGSEAQGRLVVALKPANVRQKCVRRAAQLASERIVLIGAQAQAQAQGRLVVALNTLDKQGFKV
jgi:hypothetical protein